MLGVGYIGVANPKFFFRRKLCGGKPSDELATAAPKIDHAWKGKLAGQKSNNQPLFRLVCGMGFLWWALGWAGSAAGALIKRIPVVKFVAKFQKRHHGFET